MTSDPLGVIVIGAGDHSKVVISVLRASARAITGVLDDNEAKWGQTLLGVPILGPLHRMEQYAGHPAVIAIGNNHTRQRIAGRFAGAAWTSVVHPFSYIDPSARTGPGCMIFAGAVIQPGAVVGAHVIVNTGATVDHDNRIGDFAHVAPGAHLAGHVTVEEGAFIGLGATLLPRLTVGRHSTVGGGAVVTKNVPPNTVVAGVPAREHTRTRIVR